jgi:hypothetical protein
VTKRSETYLSRDAAAVSNDMVAYPCQRPQGKVVLLAGAAARGQGIMGKRITVEWVTRHRSEYESE